MVCPSCYQDYISQCPASLSIKAGLTADTAYKINITDKFGRISSGYFTTDGDGIGIIHFDEETQAVYTPYSGSFYIEVIAIDSYNVINLTINETAYTCIEFEVRGGDFQKTYLGEFVEEAASS